MAVVVVMAVVVAVMVAVAAHLAVGDLEQGHEAQDAGGRPAPVGDDLGGEGPGQPQPKRPRGPERPKRAREVPAAQWLGRGRAGGQQGRGTGWRVGGDEGRGDGAACCWRCCWNCWWCYRWCC